MLNIKITICQGLAAVELVKQALAAQAVFVFGELLDMQNIKVRRFNTQNSSKYWLSLMDIPDVLVLIEELPRFYSP